MAVRPQLRSISSTNNMLRKLIFLLSIVFLVSIHAGSVFADDCEDLDDPDKRVTACEKKLDQLSQQRNTLSGEIAYFNTQISLTQSKIQSTIAEIAKRTELLNKLVGDIENLSIRIEKLSDSIVYQTKVLQERLRERYKSGESSPVIVLFGSNSLDSLVKKTEYLRVLQIQDQKLLNEMKATKEAFTIQKNLFEEKKAETEELKRQVEEEKRKLEAYNVDLADQKAEKENLLQKTQNDEVKYQALLEEAQAQAAGFSSFVNSAGGGVIDANGFGKGKEGWYMSQRDERWAGKRIGKSNESIFSVGCLVTSVAMVQKSYGKDVTPSSIASKSSNFFGSTALMYRPWPAPSGKSYHEISKGQIKGELEDGHPVIVGVYAGAFGTHFVVLADTKGSDYVMYDPYYGPDLSFSKYYSTGSIFQAVVFK